MWVNLDLDLIFLTKMGMCDIMAYIWMPPKDIREVHMCTIDF